MSASPEDVTALVATTTAQAIHTVARPPAGARPNRRLRSSHDENSKNTRSSYLGCPD
jgi:hypothetical protein